MNAQLLGKLTTKLAPVIAKTNGKKTYTGLAVSALGGLCLYKGAVDAGITALSLGIPLLLGGGYHKVKKARKKKEAQPHG